MDIKFEGTLKEAACRAFEEEFSFMNDSEVSGYRHNFRNGFSSVKEECLNIAEHRYVLFGRRIIRKSLAVALIAVMIIATAGLAYALGTAVVKWTVFKPENSEYWNVWFETDDPEEWDFKKVVYQPEAASDITVTSENLSEEEPAIYEIVYTTSDGSELRYYEILGITEGYFGAKVTPQKVKNIKIGDFSGQHFYESNSDMNIILWTDGYSLFSLEGEYDYKAMKKMAENMKVIKVLK